MQYAILNFRDLMCVCVCVCVCVCARAGITGFFKISEAKRRHTEILRKTELQHNRATNTDSIYRTVKL